ncbi:MAG: phage capsid protein [Pseudomonadota bacterium]
MSYAERFAQTHRLNYADAWRLAADHNTSMLRAAVTEHPCEGEMHTPVTYYDSGKAQRREGRGALMRDTPANRRRRWLKYQPTFDCGELIDSNDKFQGMMNFQSPLLNHHMANVRRFIDQDVILAGFYGDAYEGDLGQTAVPFPAGNQIAVNVQAGVGTGPVGMNLAKIKMSRKRLALNKFDLNIDEPYLFCTAEQIDDLSEEIQLTSADYKEEAGPAFSRDGKLSKVWNHWIVEYQDLPIITVAARPTQRNPVWIKSCMALGVWMDVTSNAYPRPELDNELYMIVKANMDCRRLDEKGCMDILSDIL